MVVQIFEKKLKKICFLSFSVVIFALTKQEE